MKRMGPPVLALFLVVAAGCTVGPNYKRPAISTPSGFRGTVPGEAPSTMSLADEKWPDVFRDPALQRLVTEALANNLDLQVAAQRVLEAQTQVGIVRSQQLPSVSGGASYSAIQVPSSLTGNNSDGTPAKSLFNAGGFSGSAAWNLDFWGLYRRQTEAARAELVGTEWAAKAIRLSLLENVAQAYFQLRSLDAQLSITQATIDNRRDSLRLTQALEQGGASSLADVRQAEELLHGAQANLPELRRETAAEENALSVLLGRAPDNIERGTPIAEQPHPAEIPIGIPSQLLERRPDIQQAESKLVAANARIGVARAQFFPQISLTGLGGSASSQLTSLFAGQNAYWYAAGSISQPIFEGGRIRNKLSAVPSATRRDGARVSQGDIECSQGRFELARGVSGDSRAARGTVAASDGGDGCRAVGAPALLGWYRQLPGGPDHRHGSLRRPITLGAGAAAGGIVIGATLHGVGRRLAMRSQCQHCSRKVTAAIDA